MRAAVFDESRTFTVEEVDKPEVGQDEVLVELEAASLCGTDLDYYLEGSDPAKFPVILGHEGAGVIAETGPGVTSHEVGDHVVPHYILSCGQCKHCRRGHDNRCRERRTLGHSGSGTFAEYMKIPARNAIYISEDVPFSWGSIIGCAVSTAYHAVKRADIKNGDTALVFGIGGVGLHAILWANFSGASQVIAVDPIPAKHKAGRSYGADVVLDPGQSDVRETIDEVTDGFGVDAVIECSGSSKAMEQAFDAVTGKNKHETGTVVSVGAQYDPLQTDYWGLREGWLTVSGDHAASDLSEIIALVESGKIDLSDSISHTFGLDEIETGLEVMQNEDNVQRVVIDI